MSALLKRRVLVSGGALASLALASYLNIQSNLGFLLRLPSVTIPCCDPTDLASPPAQENPSLLPAIEIWSDTHVNMPPICRIYGVCYDGGEEMVLPHHFRNTSRLRTALRACGVQKFKSLPPDAPASYAPVDLVGPRAFSGDKVEFLEELLPLMFVVDEAAAGRDSRRVVCMTRTGAPCGDTDTQVGDGQSASGASPNGPAVGHPRMLAGLRGVFGSLPAVGSDWHRNVLWMASQGFGSEEEAEASVQPEHIGTEPPRCVSSAVLTSATTADLQYHPLKADSAIYRRTGLARRRSPSCRLQLTVVSSQSTGRLEGTDQLRRALAKHKNAKGMRQLQLHIKWVRFEDQGMQGQVSAMQESDIVLWARGPNLGNMIFIKPGSLVLEVLPLGLDPRSTSHLAGALGLDHQWFPAYPAPLRELSQCNGNNATFLDIYREIAQDFEEGGSGASNAPWDRRSVECMLKGPHTYDVDDVAMAVVDRAHALCLAHTRSAVADARP